jgi:hypothetical protein
MVVPAKKACVKYSWFFCFTTSIPITSKNVRPDIKIKVVQKPGVKKLLFPVYWSAIGGIAIMKINSRKIKIEVEIFINDEFDFMSFIWPNQNLQT